MIHNVIPQSQNGSEMVREAHLFGVVHVGLYFKSSRYECKQVTGHCSGQISLTQGGRFYGVLLLVKIIREMVCLKDYQKSVRVIG